VAAERFVVFSSDYPHYDTDDPTRVIASLPADLKDRICYQNAFEVLPRLPVPAGT
jgi:predicted TIM-barrel fold metal-dependent hydrolase